MIKIVNHGAHSVNGKILMSDRIENLINQHHSTFSPRVVAFSTRMHDGIRQIHYCAYKSGLFLLQIDSYIFPISIHEDKVGDVYTEEELDYLALCITICCGFEYDASELAFYVLKYGATTLVDTGNW